MAGVDLPGAAPRFRARDPSGLRWQCLPFEQAPAPMLYQVLALRSRVFVVEQQCLYEDMDGADVDALLLVGTRTRGDVGEATGGPDGQDAGAPGGEVVATARVLPPGARFAEPSIGRVCVAPGARGQGWGRLLMDFAIACARQRHPGLPVRISAQAHLRSFYENLGFEAASEPYLEDGIPHLEMLLAAR